MAVAGLLFLNACDSPSFVEVAVENPTEYSADVSVQGTSDGSSLKLGFVGPRSERRFHQVIDQGETWIFTFEHAGKYEETVPFPREELERSEWQVEVPESFADALRGMGQSPSP